MDKSSFTYNIYIRTTPEELWSSLTTTDFMKQYWMGVSFEADWKAGGDWKMVYPDGRVTDTGTILEFDPPRRLVLKWRNEFMPELHAEGYGTCTMEITQDGNVSMLSVVHSMDMPNSKLVTAVSGGWPKILSNLKSLIETGEAIIHRKPG